MLNGPPPYEMRNVERTVSLVKFVSSIEMKCGMRPLLVAFSLKKCFLGSSQMCCTKKVAIAASNYGRINDRY